MTALEGQFQTQMSAFTQTFTQAEASRAERYDKWQETQQAKADEAFSELAKKYAAGLVVLTDYEDQAGKVDQWSTRHKQARTPPMPMKKRLAPTPTGGWRSV
jgi:hypothetical protein